MDESHLYARVSESIRRQILDGTLQPGERLPTVRVLARQWNCSPGTIQRALSDLSANGLVTSRTGKGTYVAGRMPPDRAAPLRQAGLVHRAETFLLEALTAGHTVEEIEQAVMIALDRWRVIQPEVTAPSAPTTIRFAGSHDPAVAWLAGHFSEINPAYQLQAQFIGSLGGLISLAEGKADIAGCHLWDEESNTYNLPFVRRLLPGQAVTMVHLAYRRLGMLLPPGNPLNIRGLPDLTRPEVRFINRQPGSGTRVWLDAQLHRQGIPSARIDGYSREVSSHSAVAQAIVEGEANCAFGLETAAMAYYLDFIFLTREEYHLVIPGPQLERPVINALLEWLSRPAVKAAIADLGGYETDRMGESENFKL